MSQVKKLQTGGSITIDGIKYDATPEFINALSSHIGSVAGTDAQTLAGLTNALQNGENLTYNSASNTITGMNGLWGGISDRQNENRRANTSRWRKFWDAQFDTDAHRFRNALTAIGSFHWQPNDKGDDEKSNLKDIYGDKTWYKYDVDKDGNKTWLDNAGENIAIAQRLADVTSYLKDPEAGKKAYRLGSWYTPDRVAALQGLYGKYTPETWQAGLDAIAERAKSNTLSAEDRAFLANFNIVEPKDSNSVSSDSNDTDKPDTIAVPNDWGDSASKAAIRAGIGIKKGDDGRYRIYGNNPYVNGTYYLKGYDFAAGTPFENGILYNGELFTENEVFDPNGNASMQAAVQPFISAWRNRDMSYADRRAAALASGVHFYGENQDPFSKSVDPTQSYVKQWSRYFADNKLNGVYNVIDLGNMFTNLGDQKVISYIDNKDYDSRNRYGIDNPRYLVMDKAGNVTRYDTLDALQTATGLQTNTDVYGFSPKEIQANPYDFQNKNKDFAVYQEFKVGNQTNTIYIDREGHLYWARKNDKGENMEPRFVYDVDTLNRILENGIGNNEQINKIYSEITRPKTKINPALTSGRVASVFVGMSPNPVSVIGRIASPILSGVSVGSNSKYVKEQQAALPKYQFGGPIQQVQNTVVSKSTKDSITDVTKNHAIDSSEGGLTNEEKTKIMAAVGDLAGVGLSFIPGVGGILGATTGAASTIARFNAEKEMGQSGAGTRLATGLALDAASIIPMLGKGVKATKAVTAIKSAGEEILKLLAITGATAPVVTAVNRIKNGEKYTASDLAQAISGISSAVVAGNIFTKQIGESKLARQVAQGKTTSENVVEVGGYTDKSTPQQLSDFVRANPTEKKAINAVISTAKDTQGVTLNETQAKEVLTKQGITFNKGKINFNPIRSKNSEKPKFLGRSENVVGYKEPSVKSEFRYFIDPISRNRTLNGQNDISLQQILDAQLRLNNGSQSYRNNEYSKLVDRALLNQTAYRPYTFGELLQTETGYLPAIMNPSFVLGGNQYYRLPNMNTKSYLEGPVDTPFKLGELRGRYEPTVDPNILKRRELIRQYKLEQLWKNLYNNRNDYYKKGGKIQKGATGLKPTLDADPELQKYLDNELYNQLDFQTKTGNYSKYFDEFGIRRDANDLPKMSGIDRPDNSTVQLNNQAQQRIQNRITEGTNQHSQGTFSAEKYNPDLNVPLNWARSLYAMKQSDKQLENFLNRPGYQMQAPLLNAPRYINTGTGSAYRVQADNTRISKPVTSDAMQNDLMQRSRQQEARQLELQGALADSQEYGQYKAGLDEFNNNNVLRNTEIANQNGQLRWQHGIENVQAKNANIAEKSKFFDQAAYATQDWYNRNYQTMQGLEGSQAYTQKLGDLDKWYRNERLAIERRKLEGDALAQELASLNTRLALKKQELVYDNLYWNLSPSFRNRVDRNIRIAKSGTKISSDGKRSAVTYSKDPYPELLLQNSKDSAQAVKQLNDAIIKLLLQTKPINVH